MPDQIDAIIDALEDVAERVVVAISTSFVANVQAPPQAGGTPRDTGWAAANWIARVGEPIQSKPTPKDRGGQVGSAKAASASSIVSLQTSYTLSQGKVFAGNPVPYLVPLNNGSSRQAPKGFIQQAIRKAVTVDLARIAQ